MNDCRHARIRPRSGGAAALAGWIALLALACSRPSATEPPPGTTIAERGAGSDQVRPTPGAATAPSPPPIEPAVAGELARARTELDAAVAREAADDEVAKLAGRLGMLALAYDLAELAQPPLELAAARAPTAARWSYYLARVRRQAGDTAGTIAALRHTLELAPEYQAARLELAETLLKTGELAAAAEVAREALARRPGDAAALAVLGRAELALAQPAAAVEHLDAALRAAPEATLLHYPLGLAYRALGREREARAALARRGAGAIAVDNPWLAEVEALATGASALERRANHELASGRLEAAAATLGRVVDADPDRSDAHTNLAAIAMSEGRLDAARAQLDAALRSDPNDSRALAALGTLLARQGRDAEAIPRYAQALAIDPDDRDAHYNLANALRRTGQPGTALAHYRRAIELDPGHQQARYALAVTLRELGRFDEAARLLEESHAALPDDPQITDELARLLAAAPPDELRDGKRALELAQALLARDGSVFHAETVAMALAELGRFDEAVRMQEAVLEAVRREGRTELEAPALADLARYRRREPRRLP